MLTKDYLLYTKDQLMNIRHGQQRDFHFVFLLQNLNKSYFKIIAQTKCYQSSWPYDQLILRFPQDAVSRICLLEQRYSDFDRKNSYEWI